MSIRFTRRWKPYAPTELHPGVAGVSIKIWLLLSWYLFYAARASRSAIACLGWAPISRSMSFPSLKMSIVGML